MSCTDELDSQAIAFLADQMREGIYLGCGWRYSEEDLEAARRLCNKVDAIDAIVPGEESRDLGGDNRR